MSESAKERILFTMHSALKQQLPEPNEPMVFPLRHWSHEERIDRLRKNLESVRSEVYLAGEETWMETLSDVLKKKQIKTLLFSPEVEMGKAMEATLRDQPSVTTELVQYERPIEAFKPKLFEIDAAITTTKGAIAENGAVVLWPDQHEPRLMSLVPPIHIAVVKAATINATFNEALESGNWTEGMPTNIVLTSGPSKTADIELVLAFGVHGPKDLVVIIID
jgi:L-lactate dehydrogenase complex protein LldG